MNLHLKILLYAQVHSARSQNPSVEDYLATSENTINLLVHNSDNPHKVLKD